MTQDQFNSFFTDGKADRNALWTAVEQHFSGQAGKQQVEHSAELTLRDQQMSQAKIDFAALEQKLAAANAQIVQLQAEAMAKPTGFQGSTLDIPAA